MIVAYDYTAGKRAPLPSHLLEAVTTLEGRELPRLSKPSRPAKDPVAQ